jgi:hypothetical protein
LIFHLLLWQPFPISSLQQQDQIKKVLLRRRGPVEEEGSHHTQILKHTPELINTAAG